VASRATPISLAGSMVHGQPMNVQTQPEREKDRWIRFRERTEIKTSKCPGSLKGMPKDETLDRKTGEVLSNWGWRNRNSRKVERRMEDDKADGKRGRARGNRLATTTKDYKRCYRVKHPRRKVPKGRRTIGEERRGKQTKESPGARTEGVVKLYHWGHDMEGPRTGRRKN